MSPEPTSTHALPYDPVQLHAILERFEDSWERGGRPRIEDYLPEDPALRRAVRDDLVHIDLERRLKSGEAARVEDYLAPSSDPPPSAEQVLAWIKTEYRVRRQAGEVDPQEYLSRFGRLRDRLIDFFGDEGRRGANGRATVPPLTGMFGRYRVERRLGAGAMGTVYLAFDTYLERPVALKVPRYRWTAQSLVDPRFQNEARTASQLRHPLICPVYDAGVLDGIPYLTMAYIDGRPLTEALSLPLPPALAAELVARVARTVAAAHEGGIVHCDLKPTNILLDGEGNPVLTDFGLAQWARRDVVSLRDGEIAGTPAYMAPEQASGDVEATSPATDVYALGVLLYEMLVGRPPFRGPVEEVLALVRTAEPTPPSRLRPDLDPRLEAICLKAMARYPAARFPSAGALADVLSDWVGWEAPALPGSMVSVSLDARAADSVLLTLREWGWDLGLEKLKAEARSLRDPYRRAARQMLLGWLAGERGHDGEARALFAAAAAYPGLAAWALLGRVYLLLNDRELAATRNLLTEAAARGDSADTLFMVTLGHARGTLAFLSGSRSEALVEFHTALERSDPSSPSGARILDALGMVHASEGHFGVAAEFYGHALEVKRRGGDDAGVAQTCAQLGRLHLDWNEPERAEELFRLGMMSARRAGDQRTEAQLTNHRGQVRLAQGRPAEAVPFFEDGVRSARGRWAVLEAFAHKDLALARMALGQVEEAEREADHAEGLFRAAHLPEGLAHVQQVRGMVFLQRGRVEQAVALLQGSAALFEQRGEYLEAARSLLVLVRERRDAGLRPDQAAATLRAALEHAERGRCTPLAAALEEQLRQASEAEYLRHVCRRLHGELPAEDRVEAATVVYAELRPDPPAGDPDGDLPLRRHLYAELGEVLEDHGLVPVQFRGDGFLALARNPDHARRAVAAALHMAAALEEFNRPRRVLHWPLWHLRVGLAGGLVWRGRLGTFRQASPALGGAPVILAEHLAAAAYAGVPCASEATREAVASWFTFSPESPRSVPCHRDTTAPGWDVLAAPP